MRRELNIHASQRIERVIDDAVAASVRVEAIHGPQQRRQTVERRIKLRHLLSEPLDELSDGLDVVLANIVGIGQVGSVQGDEKSVLVAGVRVSTLGNGAARVSEGVDVTPAEAPVP